MVRQSRLDDFVCKYCNSPLEETSLDNSHRYILQCPNCPETVISNLKPKPEKPEHLGPFWHRKTGTFKPQWKKES